MANLAEQIERMSIPEPNTGCWLWLGMAWKSPDYMRPYISVRGKTLRANRVSLEAFKGPIPSGMYACHTCHNSMCVNPDHLYPGTARQNTQDMMRAGRHFAQSNPLAREILTERITAVHKARRAAPFCKQGHLLEGDNLIFYARHNRRRCRTCRQRSRQEQYNASK